ncbi:DMT family transporter [Ideonella sp. BN130291]|uniref:DMT family transporter n=1 Tax=Ideonella sp. BN130291 TaxID=3112940 RepID=UPI002E2534AA|nr:DMT family transporter [Ideonella sp. BN130291]
MPAPSSTALAAPAPAAVTSRRGVALLAGAAAAASFISMDSVIKLISPRYDAFQLSFFRFASGAVFAVLLWLWHRSPLPQRSAWRLHALRSALLLVSLVTYFHALTVLPLAMTVAISYLAPILVSVLAVLVLHERPSPWIWLALLFGFGGVFVTLWPELNASLHGAGSGRLLGIASVGLSALAFSGVMVLARQQAQNDSMWTILLIQNVLPMLLLAVPAGLTWKPVQVADLLQIALAGGFATVGLLSLTYAFTRLEASRVAPLEYTSFIWATALGYVLFGEVPSATTGVSAALIVTGCLLLMRR